MSEPHCVFCSDEEQAGPCFGPGRCMAEPARLSHDRGADAETLTRALDELQDAIDASQWVTAGNRLAALRAALLSVPAPTLPALDVETLRRVFHEEYERQDDHRRGCNHRLPWDCIARRDEFIATWELVRDAV